MSWSGYGWRCPCGGAVRSDKTPREGMECDACGPFDSSWRMVRVDIVTDAQQDLWWIHLHGLADSAEPRRGHICPVCRVAIGEHETQRGPVWNTGAHHIECPQQGTLPPYTETLDGPLLETRFLLAYTPETRH